MSSPATSAQTTQSSATASIRVLAVVGPTAVGKTEFAEELAIRLGGEIVSADSMQVYRGMDIGTAKPGSDERRVPYHCIDIAEPGQPFSAALYQSAARAAVAEITALGALPVLCGGTGLYVRAALDSMDFPAGDQTDNPSRERYEATARERGPEALYALLHERDPAAAAAIHPNNTRRVVRALEMLDGGVSYADQVAGFARRESVYATRLLGLTMERPKLYERINARVDRMVALGLLGEVETLLARGFREALTAQQAIGYKELVPVVEEGASLEDAVDAIKRASRRYAKRQLTWFRADSRVVWLDVTEMSLSEAADAALATLDW